MHESSPDLTEVMGTGPCSLTSFSPLCRLPCGGTHGRGRGGAAARRCLSLGTAAPTRFLELEAPPVATCYRRRPAPPRTPPPGRGRASLNWSAMSSRRHSPTSSRRRSPTASSTSADSSPSSWPLLSLRWGDLVSDGPRRCTSPCTEREGWDFSQRAVGKRGCR